MRSCSATARTSSSPSPADASGTQTSPLQAPSGLIDQPVRRSNSLVSTSSVSRIILQPLSFRAATPSHDLSRPSATPSAARSASPAYGRGPLSPASLLPSLRVPRGSGSSDAPTEGRATLPSPPLRVIFRLQRFF